MNRYYFSFIMLSGPLALQAAVPFKEESNSGRQSSVSLVAFNSNRQFQPVSDKNENEENLISESMFGVNIFAETPVSSHNNNLNMIHNVATSSFKNNAFYKWWAAVWAKLTMCFPSKESKRD